MTTPASSGARERILVIDDEEAVRTTLVRAIARGGYESFTACDGMVAQAWGHPEAVTTRALSHHSPYATKPHDRAGLLSVVATGVAEELTGEPDLTGNMPTPELIARCACALGLADRDRASVARAAAAELQAVLEVL